MAVAMKADASHFYSPPGSRDPDRASAVARRLTAGMIGINRACAWAPGTPWVGAGESGFGFHKGRDGHRQFTQTRVVSSQERAEAMKRSWILYGAVLLAVASVVLLAWARRDTYVPVSVGSPAPTFSAHDLQGTPTSLEDFRGKVILLNLWATWCTPCKEEMPSIQRLYEQVNTEGFEVLAVSIDLAPDATEGDSPLGGKLRAFTDSLGLTFTILHDPMGRIAETYQTAGVPESFVIDGSGIIVREVPGPLAWDRPEEVEYIQRLLEG